MFWRVRKPNNKLCLSLYESATSYLVPLSHPQMSCLITLMVRIATSFYFIITFLFCKDLSESSFRLTMKLRGKYRYFPYNSYLYACTASPIIYVTHQIDIFVTQDEPTLIHHNPTKHIVYFKVHSWCCTHGSGQMYIGMCYSVIQSISIALKIICALLVQLSHALCPPTPPPLATTDLFIIPIVLPFPECPIIRIICYVAFSEWLLSLSIMQLRFLHVFHVQLMCL